MLTKRPQLHRVDVLVGLAVLAQVFCFQRLLTNQSDNGDFLGRYSYRYALALGAGVIVSLAWVVFFVKRHPWIERLQHLKPRWRQALIIISGLGLVVLCFLPLESEIKEYFTANWMLVAVTLFGTAPERHNSVQPMRRWMVALGVLVAVVMLLTMLTSLVKPRFDPDEAQWADYASSVYRAGGMYSRTWLQTPVVISPGLGWSVAAYGWVLENVEFNFKTGRLWDYLTDLLAFAGIALLAWRLYGRRAALVSTLFAAFSYFFALAYDYRPDHQLGFASTLVVFAAVQARLGKPSRIPWHFVCGLLAVLATELHAAAIVFVFGLSLFYLIEFVKGLRSEPTARLRVALEFGTGVLLSAVVYYVANVQPVGGLDAFLSFLASSRLKPSAARQLVAFNWPSLVEYLVIVASIGYLIWRRNRIDRLFLALLGCIVLGDILLDLQGQGYFTPFFALYIVPVGVMLVEGLPSVDKVRGCSSATVWISAVILCALALRLLTNFVTWPEISTLVRTGRFPLTVYEELATRLPPLISDEDVVVSTHQLIWSLPEQAQLYGVAGEVTGMQRWDLTDPAEVWERVQPTVIVYIDNQMHFDPGLQTYMDRHQFQVCDTMSVQNVDVRLYRADCQRAT